MENANEETRPYKRRKITYISTNTNTNTNTEPVQNTFTNDAIRNRMYGKFHVFESIMFPNNPNSYFNHQVIRVFGNNDISRTQTLKYILDIYKKLAVENFETDVLDRENFVETHFIRDFVHDGIKMCSRIWVSVLRHYVNEFISLEEAYEKFALSNNELFKQEIIAMNQFIMLICQSMAKCGMHKKLLSIVKIFEDVRKTNNSNEVVVSDKMRQYVEKMNKGKFHSWIECKDNKYGLIAKVVYTSVPIPILNERYMHVSIDFLKMKIYTGEKPFDSFGCDEEEEEEEDDDNGTNEPLADTNLNN